MPRFINNQPWDLQTRDARSSTPDSRRSTCKLTNNVRMKLLEEQLIDYLDYEYEFFNNKA